MNSHVTVLGVVSNENDESDGCVNRLEREILGLTRALSLCIFHINDEVVLEATRTFGNLTRSVFLTFAQPLTCSYTLVTIRLSICIDAVRTARVDEALLLLLNHRNIEITQAATGALVNISSDRCSLISRLSHS